MGDVTWRDQVPGRPFTGEVSSARLPLARLMRHERLTSNYTSNEIIAYFDRVANAQNAADTLNGLSWQGTGGMTFEVEPISVL